MTTNTVEARSLSSLGGPPGLPVIGNLLQFDIARLHQKLEHWARDYGPIFRVRIGPRLRVCVTDTDAINHMLRERPELYRRPQVTASVMDEMGFHGVFSQDGEAWRRQRKVVTPALNPAHLSSFYPAMVVTTERLLQRWHNAAAANMSVDACRELMRYTVDVTAHLAFGIDVNTLETDGAVIQQHLDKVFPMLFRRVVAPFPIWRYWRSAADRELDKALTEIRATVLEIIADCRQRMHDDQTLYASPTNFLEAIIAAQRTETVEFSEAEIYANVINLLLAGEDTTANTIAWAMSFFMSHPAMFGVARDEVDAVLGDAKVVKDLND
jgi:cytochrome P450